VWAAIEGPATLPAPGALRALAPLLAVQGCVLGYGGTLLWYLAIARIDLARATAIVVPSIPLLSLAASFVLLGEVATAAQWVGLVLTAAGIAAFVTDEGRDR
jgi:drug/metabolite transporter (DMT)-like permease